MEIITEPSLDIHRYRLNFQGEKAGAAHYWHAFVWRGSLGNRLRALACPMPHATDCKGCLMRHRCAYHYIFETAPPPATGKMRRYPAIPRPYILNPVISQSSGRRYVLELLLMGKANEHLPLVLAALNQAGQDGLRQGLGKKRLGNVDCWHPRDNQWIPLERCPHTPATPPIPALPTGSIQIQFHSPLRLRQHQQEDGSQPLLQPGQLRFHHLFNNLLRRLSTLSYFHCDKDLHVDFKALSQSAASVPMEATGLFTVKAQRHSSRQGRNIPMDGIVGSLRLDSAHLAPFWPYLWLGQWSNAGRGANMGMGRYRLSRYGEIQ